MYSMMLIYIAHPYTIGFQSHNIHRAVKCADKILDMGAVPIIPTLNHLWDIISPKPADVWYNLTEELLVRCNAVYRLSGESKGADNEVKLALQRNIPVFYTYDSLLEYIRS